MNHNSLHKLMELLNAACAAKDEWWNALRQIEYWFNQDEIPELDSWIEGIDGADRPTAESFLSAFGLELPKIPGPDYIHKRPDGGEIHCYGTIEEDSNFELTCLEERYDGVWCSAYDEMTVANWPPTWEAVCRHLVAYYHGTIEQIVTC